MVRCDHCGYRGVRVVAAECPRHNESVTERAERLRMPERVRLKRSWGGGFESTNGEQFIEYVRVDVAELRARRF